MWVLPSEGIVRKATRFYVKAQQAASDEASGALRGGAAAGTASSSGTWRHPYHELGFAHARGVLAYRAEKAKDSDAAELLETIDSYGN